MELRWLNERLQVFNSVSQQWETIPTVSEPAEVSQCPTCGSFHTGTHTCWIEAIKV